MLNDEQTKLLNLLAQIDRISAQSQLLITSTDDSHVHDSVARLRVYMKNLKTKLNQMLDRLGNEA